MQQYILWIKPVAKIDGFITWGGYAGIWKLLSFGIIVLQNDTIQRIQIGFTLGRQELALSIGSFD